MRLPRELRGAADGLGRGLPSRHPIAGLTIRRRSGREPLARGDAQAVRSAAQLLTELDAARCTSTFPVADHGARAVYVTGYDCSEALQTVLDTGVEDGARTSIDQIDGLVG